MKLDAVGDVQWSHVYYVLAGVSNVFQKSYNGWVLTSNSGNGGPGLWLVKMDSTGDIGSCSCSQDTNATAQELDLSAYPATFTEDLPGLAFSAVNINGKSTSVKPKTIYP
jgi:hypothetical protein